MKGYRKASGNLDAMQGAIPSLPLMTIITVAFNAVEHIEETIKSVLGQTYDNVEYIIVDGGSSDGTLDVIRKYDHAIDYWISERDGGIYEAMNKGLALASGYYIALLNASDWYGRDLLSMVAQTHVESAADDRSIIYTNFQLYFAELQFAEKRPCSVEPWKGMTISHQAMFVGAGVYRELGHYDVSYRLAADYDFFLRAYRAKVRFVRLDDHGVYFRAGGRSAVNKLTSVREAARALRSAYGGASFHLFRYLAIELSGLLYYRYFQNFLVRLAGEKNITAIRKLRRGLPLKKT